MNIVATAAAARYILGPGEPKAVVNVTLMP